MIGIPGTRRVIKTADGLTEQRWFFADPEQKAALEALFPPGQAPLVSWGSAMTCAVGPARIPLIFQSVTERDEFRMTLRQGYQWWARWSADSVLLGSAPPSAQSPGPPPSGPPAPVGEAEDLEAKSDAQLRRLAAERGLNPKRTSPRAELLALLRGAVDVQPTGG